LLLFVVEEHQQRLKMLVKFIVFISSFVRTSLLEKKSFRIHQIGVHEQVLHMVQLRNTVINKEKYLYSSRHIRSEQVPHFLFSA